MVQSQRDGYQAALKRSYAEVQAHFLLLFGCHPRFWRTLVSLVSPTSRTSSERPTALGALGVRCATVWGHAARLRALGRSVGGLAFRAAAAASSAPQSLQRARAGTWRREGFLLPDKTVRDKSHLPRTAVYCAFSLRPSSHSARGLLSACPLLSCRLVDSFKRLKARPGEPVTLKQFQFSAQSRHVRTIIGERFEEYMSLPVEEYALYDPELMRRVDDGMFELCLPLSMGGGGLDMRPTMR
eukprot:6066922-Prymnesium_polylepis.2